MARMATRTAPATPGRFDEATIMNSSALPRCADAQRLNLTDERSGARREGLWRRRQAAQRRIRRRPPKSDERNGRQAHGRCEQGGPGAGVHLDAIGHRDGTRHLVAIIASAARCRGGEGPRDGATAGGGSRHAHAAGKNSEAGENGGKDAKAGHDSMMRQPGALGNGARITFPSRADDAWRTGSCISRKSDRGSQVVQYFLALVIDGALAGAIYALIALAFVLVYKASAMINFAIGEWIMLGALLAGVGMHLLQLGAVGALAFAGIGMIALAACFCRFVVRRLVARPAIAAIMVTIGLGMILRGLAPLLFPSVSGLIPSSMLSEPWTVGGIDVPANKLAAAGVAVLCTAAIGLFYRISRTGVALRAIADDPQAAMSAGIDVDRHLLFVWGLT
ncbi:MAG: branched-chain amino acid ABC transporter permease, partial [Alphaproteobacteria bacterium]